MSLHDAYPRLTPYERFLPDPDFPARRFPAIAGEAARKGVVLDDPGAFAVLEASSEALEELRVGDDAPETLARHALMLFHAFHHHGAGTEVYLLTVEVVRRLVAAPAVEGGRGAGEIDLPASVYLQFPQHMVWARSDGDSTPASLDGAFRTVTADGQVHVLAVGGLLGDRPGFMVLPVPAAPAAHRAHWVGDLMRPDGGDFTSTIPGSELEGLVEIRTVGEALKLVARAVDFMAEHPDPAPAGASPTRHDDAARGPSSPPPSVLPGRRVELEVAGG